MSIHGDFDFEKPEPQSGSQLAKKRDREAAERKYLPLLLKRLTDGKHEGIAAGGRRDTLVRYCVDVLASLDWYRESMRKMQAQLDAKNNAALKLGVGAVVLVTALSFGQSLLRLPPMTEAQVTLMLMGFLYVLRQLYAGTDYKSRLGAFWQASAALKANFYGLEESWRGKAVVDPQKNDLADGFYDALKTALNGAQAILEAERKTFFSTFKNPSEVLGEALSAVKDMRAEADTYGKAVEAATKKEEAAAQRRETEAQAKLSAAQAVVAQEATIKELQFVIERLRTQGDKGGNLAIYEEKLINAEAKLGTLKAKLAKLQQA